VRLLFTHDVTRCTAISSAGDVVLGWNPWQFRRRKPVVTLQTPRSTAFENLPNSACASAARNTNFQHLTKPCSDDNADGRMIVKVATIYTLQRTCLIGAVSAQAVMYRRRDILVDNILLLSTPPLTYPIQLILMYLQSYLSLLTRRRKTSNSLTSNPPAQQTSHSIQTSNQLPD